MADSTNDTYWFDRNVNYIPDHEEPAKSLREKAAERGIETEGEDIDILTGKRVAPEPIDMSEIESVGLIKFDVLGVAAANLCPECKHPWPDHREDFCHRMIYRYERCHCTNKKMSESC